MSQNPQVIQLLTDIAGSFIHNEALAAAGSGIIPGMLVEEVAGEVQENGSAADVTAQKLFALTNLATAGTIDDVYGVGETVRYGAAHGGQEVYGWVADGGSVTAGDALESAGDGTLRTRTTGRIVAYALETVAAAGSNERLRARVA